MKIAQHLFESGKLTHFINNDPVAGSNAQLVLIFGEKEAIAENKYYGAVKLQYPAAAIVSCSTAGEIYTDKVLDNTICVTAIEFEKTTIKTARINIAEFSDSFSAGQSLVSGFDTTDLSYIMVLSDGHLVNGSELVKGMDDKRPDNVLITGGLAGDADKFISTLVGLNENIQSGNIVAVAFYGKALQLGHGCMGGWDMFGPERTITKSTANVLHEIDGKSALKLYKEYLGKYADELPGSALLFPISVLLPESNSTVVRTILSIDEENQTMTFAGDVPENAQVRFMRANFDKIIDAAASAADQTLSGKITNPPKLALLISCVGRKLILNNRAEEEVEAINKTFKGQTFLTGFYSYGEISPLAKTFTCELHNQTMAITTFDED